MAQKDVQELDFEKKHAEDLQRLRNLRLLDDDFMSKVFEEKGCTEFFASDYFESKRPACTSSTWAT